METSTVSFTIRATAGAFVDLLQALTKDAFLERINLGNGQRVQLLPYLGGPPDNWAVPICSEELAQIPEEAIHPLAGDAFSIGNQVFASVPHDHSDVQGRIVAMWADKVSITEDGRERTDYEEAVAIGFK